MRRLDGIIDSMGHEFEQTQGNSGGQASLQSMGLQTVRQNRATKQQQQITLLGFLGGEAIKTLPAVKGQEGPQRRKGQPTPVLLPGKFCGQRSLVGYSPWGCTE